MSDQEGRPPSSAGDRRRAHARERAAAAAAAGPSAARWWVHDRDDEVVVDVVADLLALDPRTRLRGRGDERLRALARRIDPLIAAEAVAPSGRRLLDVVVQDRDAHETFVPQLDLDALLAGATASSGQHDRTVRLAEALLERAAAHRSGAVDLHAEVAPVGVDRHPVADEVDALVATARTPQAPAATSSEPAVVVVRGGWLGASPFELFVTAAHGLLDGMAAQAAGAALGAWLGRTRHDPGDAWWVALSTWLPVDPGTLLDGAAARAGSDHPDVAATALVDAIAGSYRLGPR